ncbi:MAG: GAF domain-containing protein [Micrococcales bacterium]|nr:GAF domain-containing protein [Micrococcales bacterium]
MATTDGHDGSPTPRGADLDLEDLLDELRVRASTARRSQERMRDLLAAVLAVSADLELPEVLTRIVTSGMSLVGARYGALGVVDPQKDHLVEFITAGITPQERALIGDLPRGHGILGLLIRDPHPRRLRDIATHPHSFGFPPNHPEMHSFLGTPIRIRDEVFGNLYLTEKQGAEEFTEEDEAILVALSAAAGVAIDNARMYDAGRRRRAFAEALAQVTTMLLEGEDEDVAAGVITAQVGRLGGCTHVVLALLDEAEQLVVRDVYHRDRASTAVDTGSPGDRPVLEGAHWQGVGTLRSPVRVLPPDAAAEAEQAMRADVIRLVSGFDIGSIAVLPLTSGHGALGVLVLAWAAHSEIDPTGILPELTDYAGQVGLALLAGRSQRDRSQMALLDDRDRIARDMHDHVIQRLFATGLSLQSAARVAQHPMVQARLDEAVDELDVAIREIRHAIFELHQSRPAHDAEQDLTSLGHSFTRGLGFAPAVIVDGPVDQLDPALRSDIVAVVREGLTNVVRHAQAHRADVRVSMAQGRVTIEIVDDGVGLGDRRQRSGLANLAERAIAAGGTFDTRTGQAGGTVLSWCVPLDRA